RWLDKVAKGIDQIGARAQVSVDDPHDKALIEDDVTWWTRTLLRQLHAIVNEIDFLLPWHTLPDAAVEAFGADDVPSLRALAEFDHSTIANRLGDPATPQDKERHAAIRDAFEQGSNRARERLASIDRLILQCGTLATMEYDFLYDEARHLLAIGYNASDR